MTWDVPRSKGKTWCLCSHEHFTLVPLFSFCSVCFFKVSDAVKGAAQWCSGQQWPQFSSDSGLSVWSCLVFPVPAWVQCRYSSFLPQLKDTQNDAHYTLEGFDILLKDWCLRDTHLHLKKICQQVTICKVTSLRLPYTWRLWLNF